MFSFITTSLEAIGQTAEGYLTLMQNHSKAWQVEQAIEQSFAHKKRVADVALKMQKLASELQNIDPDVITETNTMITETLTKRGLL